MRNAACLFAVLLPLTSAALGVEDRPPNFIIVFADDQGYGDLGCFGSPDIETPRIDRMADEGIRFTCFYAAPFCGPSRAALMTGCYPPRASLGFNHGPNARTGINPGEITIAEVLKGQGYATMHIGKWHLGDAPRFLPTRHGFDKYLGLPYSNDMWPYHPKMPIREDEDQRMKAARKRAALTGFAGQGTYYPDGHSFNKPLPLMRDEETIEENPDQTRLTTRYTEEALDFIADNKDRPFFLYLAHAMPHVPLFVSDKYEGKSQRGLYGDVIVEIDWSTGQILDKLKQLGIDENTLVVYTSDNGPWLQYGIDGGSAGPLRDGKGSLYEGGVREPTVMRWPGHIPAGIRTSEVAANMDLLPTFAKLAGTEPPTDRVIDGRDIWPLMSGRPGAKSPHEFFYYFGGTAPQRQRANLRAIRGGEWKLHLAMNPRDGKLRGTELYDLHDDVSETRDRSAEHPDLVERLVSAAQEFNAQLGDNRRPLGRLPEE